MRNYENLEFYQLTEELCIHIYKVIKLFPKDEEYILKSQIKRASISVLANIVEGATREGNKEYKHFLNIAIGSLSEVEALLKLSRKLEYLSKSENDILIEEIIKIRKKIYIYKSKIIVK